MNEEDDNPILLATIDAIGQGIGILVIRNDQKLGLITEHVPPHAYNDLCEALRRHGEVIKKELQ